MAIEFGQDLRVTAEAGVFDIDPSGALDDGLRAAAHSVARRFVTPREGLFYDPEYGEDLRAYVAKAMTAGEVFRLRSRVAAQAEADERVLSASVSASFDAATNALKVRVACESSLGPFALTLSVSALSVDLLALEA